MVFCMYRPAQPHTTHETHHTVTTPPPRRHQAHTKYDTRRPELIRYWFVRCTLVCPVYIAKLVKPSAKIIMIPNPHGQLARVSLPSLAPHPSTWVLPPFHLGCLRLQHGCPLSRRPLAVVRLIGCSASASSDKCALYVVHSSVASHHFL